MSPARSSKLYGRTWRRLHRAEQRRLVLYRQSNDSWLDPIRHRFNDAVLAMKEQRARELRDLDYFSGTQW